MGKPYEHELTRLAETYEWAMRFCIQPLVRAVSASSSSPLLIIGSGGSLTAAHFASHLQQHFAGKLSKSVTPLEFAATTTRLDEAAVLLLSAGGRNKDIVGAFKYAVTQEPKHLTVVCSRTKSPLSQLATSYRFVDLIDFDLPTGKDGFLATNSLLAFAVIMCRAWAEAFSVDVDLPKEFERIFNPIKPLATFISQLADISNPLWSRETISVLYGPSTHSAALDLESKFTEAALGNIQIADYRNFAHGRHHWLAKRGKKTGVLALLTNDDRKLAERTLELIPTEVPIARIDIPFSGLRAALASLVSGLYLTGLAGKAQGIDPGRPGVPSFGSKIYNMQALGAYKLTKVTTKAEAIAIERKAGASVVVLEQQGELDFWKHAYEKFIRRLQGENFRAIIFEARLM